MRVRDMITSIIIPAVIGMATLYVANAIDGCIVRDDCVDAEFEVLHEDEL